MDEEKVVGQELSAAAEGTLVGKPETGVEPGADDKPVYKKSEKKAGKRIGYYYIIIKSLKESRKNDVVKCFYIKSLTKWGFCVIKEGTYGESKDKEGRDIKDRLLWQKELHEKLQDKVRMPRLLDSFEENGNYYLVMEYLRGKPLYKVLREEGDMWKQLEEGTRDACRILKYILRIVNLLQRIHNDNIVHRDITASNFMILPFGRLAVIDMELGYSITKSYPSPPFQLGTQGYMSPEQQATMMPTVKEDIYAVGAVILQLLTGVSPSKLTIGYEDPAQKVRYLIKDPEMAALICRCFDKDPLLRPSLQEIGSIVKKYMKIIRSVRSRPLFVQKGFTNDEIRSRVQEGIDSLSSPLFCDPDNGWFAEKSNPLEGGEKFQKAWYASANLGASGIIYFLSRAGRLGYDISACRKGIDLGMRLIERKYVNHLNACTQGLHFGADGIAVCLVEAINNNLLPEMPFYIDWINGLLEKKTKQNSIMNGIAGQGIAVMLCADFIPEVDLVRKLNEYVAILLEKQGKDGIWATPEERKKKKINKGFANGQAGISYFLLEYALRYGHKDVAEAGLKALDWLIKQAVTNKHISWLSGKGRNIGYGWVDGVGGIALPFLKAFQLTGDELYRRIARGALHHPPANLLQNSFSLNSGMSGLGEVYIDAFHILKEEEWRKRACNIAQTLMHMSLKRSQGSFWLVEHDRQPTAGLFAGNGGVLHFLMRISDERRTGMPMLSL